MGPSNSAFDHFSRSGKSSNEPRMGSSLYGSASAADIARFGVQPAQYIRDDAFFQPQGMEEDYIKMPPKKKKDKSKKGSASARFARAQGMAHEIPISVTDELDRKERWSLRRKVILSIAILLILSFLSLGIIGAQPGYNSTYTVHSPLEVLQMLVWHIRQPFDGLPYDASTMVSEYGFYYAMAEKAGIIGITLVCAVLLSVSGMLYQNVFKNPIAGPGMLGVSSGVTLGLMLLVYIYEAEALSKITERYVYCYALGAAVLVFVILAGRKLSGKGKPFDLVTMLLIGSLLSQLVGFVVSYFTLFVMDTNLYQVYITLSQMLVVDTSLISWVCLIAVSMIALLPVWFLRFRMNALSFNEQEVRMLGVNYTLLRAIALICGAIMILAAQVHIGAVAMVSLIVPFLSRSWFGCEFRKQLIGNICIGTIFLLVCRDVVDLIPFVGDGIGIGSAVSVLALPLFLLIMAKQMRGWE